MVLGIVIAVLTILACLMFVTKKWKNSIFQKWNHRLHKVMGVLVLLFSMIHLIMVWPLRLQRPALMYLLGFVMIIFTGILVLSFYFRKKLGKRWIVLHRIAAVGLLLCLIAHVYLGMNSLNVYKEKVSQISVQDVDLTAVSDGEYIGEENVGYIYCKVKVVVEDHKLDSVEILEHRTERGKPAERIIDTMLQEQSNKVDAVSGATNSSKVIMKAVEKALLDGKKQTGE